MTHCNTVYKRSCNASTSSGHQGIHNQTSSKHLSQRPFVIAVPVERTRVKQGKLEELGQGRGVQSAREREGGVGRR